MLEASSLNLNAVLTAKENNESTRKVAWDKSMDYAKQVYTLKEFFGTDECKALIEQHRYEVTRQYVNGQGNSERCAPWAGFIYDVLGMQKSRSNKLVKAHANRVENRTSKRKFEEFAVANGIGLSIVNYNKFCKGDLTANEQAEEENASQTISTFNIKKNTINGEKGYSMRIQSDGEIIINGEIANRKIREWATAMFAQMYVILDQQQNQNS